MTDKAVKKKNDMTVFRLESICVDEGEGKAVVHQIGRNHVHKIEWVDAEWIGVWGKYKDQSRGDSDCVHAHPTRREYHIRRILWIDSIAEGGIHRCCGMRKEAR